MEAVISPIRTVVIVLITVLLAVVTWTRCRLETLLVLLPGRAADGPGGGKRISRIRPLSGEVGFVK
ncbi:hypothetical protein [Streptomyces sp. NPDC058758]|uniref:hypothetical protein n=1 Tax=Streptomyces sp. NPDC058758 TaxID=3346627 RepID=UPI00368FDBD5